MRIDTFSIGIRDTVIGFILLIVGWLLGISNHILGIIVGIGIAIYFLITFIRDVFERTRYENQE